MRLTCALSLIVVLGACLAPAVESASSPASALQFPDTQPSRRLRELLEVVNSGDRAALVEYAKTSFAPSMMKPDDSILDFLHGQYQRDGGFEVRRIIESADHQITALVQGRTKPEVWLRYVVGTETSPPYRVLGVFTFHASAAMAEEGSGPIAEAELPARFLELVDRIAADGRFSGSVCLARDGKTLVRKAWGEADRDAHRMNTPATRFGIASVGKLFTAVGIAKLVEAGSLAYDDPVAKHIPEWLPPRGEGITIEHLLTHTSGLGDYLEIVVNDRSGRTYERLEDYRRFAIESEPSSSPGTTFRYSNTGFVLLGAIIEKVTGEPWEVWIQRNVLSAAGMSSTTAMRPAQPDSGIAIGYHPSDQGGWARTDTLMAGLGTPAGGGVSTAEDLARFASALARGRLVSKATLERMTTPRMAMTGTGMKYGYGIEIADGQRARRVYGHRGGFPGVGALVEIHEPDGYALAVLSNTTDGASVIADAWRDVLVRARTPAAKP
jgi:CubicO group peptidase (beta-lactamase class C family)